MSRLVSYLLLSLSLILFSSHVFAQAPAKEKAPDKTASTKKSPTPKAEADLMVEQRRSTALAMLIALADEAKAYRDQPLRARVLARTADALWTSNTDHARTLFRRAWDEAVAADEETARKREEDIRKQREAGGPIGFTAGPNIRNEVLRLIAKRDRALGEEFLKKSEEANAKETAASSFSGGPGSSTPSQAQRLRLASQLLQDGDVERALQYADPALASVTVDSMDFLSALRQKNAAAADERFAALLTRTANDPASDANTISGLSSYAFTPFFYVTFEQEGGASQMQRRELGAPPDLPVSIRDAFFAVAHQVLVRPSPSREQDTTTSGRVGKYMVIRRLLPLFQKYAPERVAELRVQMTALSVEVPERDRARESRALNRGIIPDDTERDPMDGLQERIDRAADQAERDTIYADAAASLARAGDPRGRDLVQKIEATELRKQTRAFMDFEYLQDALQKKDAKEAIRAARGVELTHLQRVYGLTQAAKLLRKSDPERALELLDEAAVEARRIDASEMDRPRALVAVVTGYLESDRDRAWELVPETVKAANSAETFTGDDARMGAALRFGNSIIMATFTASDFDLLGAFRTLAKANLTRAIESARNLTGESARANATLAIARSVLDEK